MAGPPLLCSRLKSWIGLKRRRFEARVLDLCPDSGDAFQDGDPRLVGVDAFVLVGFSKRAPSKVLPGLGLRDANGRFVVGSLLPISTQSAAAFAYAAGEVERRSDAGFELGPALFLGEWEPRARKMAQRSTRCLQGAGISCFEWSADRVTREVLRRGLACGAGFALYYGHGRAVGWAGYHGFRARHLPESVKEPLGAALSITCSTASRGGSGLSFSERLVTQGVAGASLGATRKTRHLSNAYLASSICQAIAGGGGRLHEVIQDACLPEDLLYGSYRIFGDPTARLRGSSESLRQAEAIYAPAPEERFDPLKAEAGAKEELPESVRREDVDLAELIGI